MDSCQSLKIFKGPFEGFFCDFVEFVGHLRRMETNFAQFYSIIKKWRPSDDGIPPETSVTS